MRPSEEGCIVFEEAPNSVNSVGLLQNTPNRTSDKKSGEYMLGGFGGLLPRENFNNGAIWCVLESILLKFCQKNNLKNGHFLYKNNR